MVGAGGVPPSVLEVLGDRVERGHLLPGLLPAVSPAMPRPEKNVRTPRELLEGIVGASTFAIWLEPAELLAVDGEQRLVVGTPEATASWTRERFGRMLAMCGNQVGRELRFASQPEIHALGGAELRLHQSRYEVAG